MAYQKEFPIIVMVGIWNNAIFQPDWVSKYLLPGEDLNVEFPIGVGSLRFSTKELRLYIVENKLSISVLNFSDEIIEKVESLAKKISEYLPHTPVSAFGYNINTEFDKCLELDKVFASSFEKFDTSEYSLTNSVIKGIYKKNDHDINLEIAKLASSYLININFHFPIKSIVDFTELTSKYPLSEASRQSKIILSSFFNLEI